VTAAVNPRLSGILLHPTSLPGRYGIGDLGREAIQFLDFLEGAEQRLWQVLPLGPTGYGDSPYQCFSAFAGNPLLVSFDLLVEQGLLGAADVAEADFPEAAVDYGRVIDFKRPRLRAAYQRARKKPEVMAQFEAFCKEKAAWLDDFALFMTVKAKSGNVAWTDWDADIRSHHPKTLKR
jgi:4-alpha-glucanotransferase